MSDYDNCTNLEIADEVEKIRRRLVMQGILHAGGDAVLIQAWKRLKKDK